jgi:hypothetical protein
MLALLESFRQTPFYERDTRPARNVENARTMLSRNCAAGASFLSLLISQLPPSSYHRRHVFLAIACRILLAGIEVRDEVAFSIHA